MAIPFSLISDDYPFFVALEICYIVVIVIQKDFLCKFGILPLFAFNCVVNVFPLKFFAVLQS